MPSGNADQLPECMGVGRRRHLAQAEIDPFGEDDVHQSDPVGAGCSGPQMGESLAEAGGCLHVQQEIGDPGRLDLPVEIERQIFGARRCDGFELFDLQNAIFDGSTRNRARARGATQITQTDIETGLTLCQPFIWPQRDGKTAAFRDSLHGNEHLLQIAIAPGSNQPDIPGPECIPQMEQDCDFPKTRIARRLRTKMTMPFRA